MSVSALKNAAVARRAGVYVRMSTDKQDQSIALQLDYIARYACDHGYELQRIYRDEGRSGLTLRDRPGLQQLLADIAGGSPGYGVLLVYDVSRWGRFQNLDQGAYYEFMCSLADVTVVYCAEAFNSDGGPLWHVMKDVKRLMAAEDSRQLSVRVYAAHVHLLAQGFKPGGAAGFGLARMSVRPDGSQRRLLQAGERKGFVNDRVVLVAGAPMEIETVQKIFDWYTEDCLSYRELARRLNAAAVAAPGRNGWSDSKVRAILTNPKYCGQLVYNRTSAKLGTNRINNRPEQWLSCSGAHAALVRPDRFADAQACYDLRRGIAVEAVLDKLRDIYRRHGRLTYRLIEAEPGMPHVAMIKQLFGSLHAAYRRALPAVAVKELQQQGQACVALLRQQLRQQVCACVVAAGHTVQATTIPWILTIDQRLSVRLSVSCLKCKAGTWGWCIPAQAAGTDFVLAALVEPNSDLIGRYALLEVGKEAVAHKWLGEKRLDKAGVPMPSCLGALFGLST